MVRKKAFALKSTLFVSGITFKEILWRERWEKKVTALLMEIVHIDKR